jgi:hypothetical protein
MQKVSRSRVTEIGRAQSRLADPVTVERDLHP